MNESEFSRELRKSLSQFGWFIKQVGGPFIIAGIPDIIGCHDGKLYAIECKIVKQPIRKLVVCKLFTDDQVIQLRKIEEAGGVALGIICLSFYRPKKALVLKPLQFNLEVFKDSIDILTRKLLTIERRGRLWDVKELFL